MLYCKSFTSLFQATIIFFVLQEWHGALELHTPGELKMATSIELDVLAGAEAVLKRQVFPIQQLKHLLDIYVCLQTGSAATPIVKCC